jgi:hypothetical protein
MAKEVVAVPFEIVPLSTVPEVVELNELVVLALVNDDELKVRKVIMCAPSDAARPTLASPQRSPDGRKAVVCGRTETL